MDKNNLTNAANETIETAKDMGREAIDKGYERGSEYVSKATRLSAASGLRVDPL